MRPELCWVDHEGKGRLAIMPRPRAGDWLLDEIAGWADEGVDLVVSLLEPSEIDELGLQREKEFCTARGIEFIAFPIPDRGVPVSFDDIARVVRRLGDWMQAGKSVAVHCRAGIGRSALVAACVMIVEGTEAGVALDRIASARGVPVPDTDQQRAWVFAFRDALKPDSGTAVRPTPGSRR